MEPKLLPAGLSTHPGFIRDARILLGLTPSVLLRIREHVDASESNFDEHTLEAVSKLIEADQARARTIVYTLRFLVTQVADGTASAEPLIKEFISVAGVQPEEETTQALVKAIAPSERDLDLIRARNAFGFGDTYLSSGFTPLYTHSGDGPLLGGVSWSIRYQDGLGTPKVVSLNVSVQELRDLARKLNQTISEIRETVPWSTSG